MILCQNYDCDKNLYSPFQLKTKKKFWKRIQKRTSSRVFGTSLSSGLPPYSETDLTWLLPVCIFFLLTIFSSSFSLAWKVAEQKQNKQMIKPPNNPPFSRALSLFFFFFPLSTPFFFSLWFASLNPFERAHYPPNYHISL